MNKHRSRRSGKFTGRQVRDPVAEAQAYYRDHQKTIDKAVNIYKANHPGAERVSNEKIFVDNFRTGISADYKVRTRSNSYKDFLKKVDYVKAYLQNYNLDAVEAKRTAWGGEAYGFGDKRKLSKKRFDLTQDYKHDLDREFNDRDDPNWFEVDGYFEIAGTDVVIARVYSKNEYSDESPMAHFEYFRKSELQ